ncbi:ABC transporter permease subunit [Paenibacillus filicis]|uniref:ABC transporter permease subunit n=1 Tax=Paenibacillus gyeongsangnamensis TaxID=3388067 RepID=A0ABT4Q227_9BACL|nr:ABC transporter permease subunit [Paenibacillus filicis]MCZ8510935.1 ABC transporter permease subunit [Paenibacillus filicis]
MKKKWVHTIIISATFLYLFLPLAATFLYSIAKEWHHTILPASYTLSSYENLYTDPRFLQAVGRTLLVTAITLVLSVVTMVTAVFVVFMYLPTMERVLQALVMIPFAVPGVVAAVGLIKVYSSGPIVLSGTIWILIGAYYVLVLPYMYQGIRNNLRTIDAKRLMEAAEVLGASKIKGFTSVIMPNMVTGMLVSALLSFSILIGEFVLANFLIGGYYETIQIYLMRRLNENGHLASAIVITYFLTVAAISWMMLRLGRRFVKTEEIKEKVT